jgi:hypothetical protein
LTSGVALFTGPTPENLSNGTLGETSNQPTFFLIGEKSPKSIGNTHLQNISKEKTNINKLNHCILSKPYL